MALEIYKKGQGYYTRMGSAIAGGLISVLGCYALYQSLDKIPVGGWFTMNVKPWISAGIPAVLLIVLAGTIYKLLNMPKCADFLIATEGEMKKVSWSSRKEVIASTRAVIITVILLGLILAGVDFLFSTFFKLIGVLEVI